MSEGGKYAWEIAPIETDEAKAESVLSDLLSQPFSNLYYFWEFEFGGISNDASICEVLKAYETELKR